MFSLVPLRMVSRKWNHTAAESYGGVPQVCGNWQRIRARMCIMEKGFCFCVQHAASCVNSEKWIQFQKKFSLHKMCKSNAIFEVLIVRPYICLISKPKRRISIKLSTGFCSMQCRFNCVPVNYKTYFTQRKFELIDYRLYKIRLMAQTTNILR